MNALWGMFTYLEHFGTIWGAFNIRGLGLTGGGVGKINPFESELGTGPSSSLTEYPFCGMGTGYPQRGMVCY